MCLTLFCFSLMQKPIDRVMECLILQCLIPLLLSSALVPQYLVKQPSSLLGILITCSSLSPSLSTVHNVVLIV